MCEGPLLRCPSGPILPLLEAIIGRSTAKGDSITFVIRAHPSECAAAGHPSLEMINV
jgi:hypothetical protein